MTYKATLAQSGSEEKLSDCKTLADAIGRHCVSEKVSFHTPGHKGGAKFACGQNLWALDVTELPGLDELAYARGVLAHIQRSASQAWGSDQSFISVNGASAALIAAILACAPRNKHVLIPRNAHRSAINALVLSGLEPIWYEPQFDSHWQIWGAADTGKLRHVIQQHAATLAAVLVTSPTYSGVISDIGELAIVCHQHSVPLIVDEAHGAHLAEHALLHGADLVVHSLHKTMNAMTQTGMIHINRQSLVDADSVHLALNMVQSSSPSYVLMSSIETAVNEYGRRDNIERVLELAAKARRELAAINGISLYEPAHKDPLHLVVACESLSAEEFANLLYSQGIYPEAILGNGILLLFGSGSCDRDVELLIAEICKICASSHNVKAPAIAQQLPYGEQVMPPRQAFFARTESIPTAQAAGRIAAQCLAPCPPGHATIVPGQRITPGALEFCSLPELRVVVESQQGER